MSAKRPLIAINCDFDPGAPGARVRRRITLYEPYAKAVLDGGGLPLLVPPAPLDALRQYLEMADGVLFTGGLDYPPELYGEQPRPEVEKASQERTASDQALMRLALKSPKPALGICAGLQLMNIVSGGALIQHLPDSLGHRAPGPEQDAAHQVQVLPKTRLAEIFGARALTVNSAHHQAADPVRVAKGLKVSAEAADGTIEGLELAKPGSRFFLFVQWHPERIPDEDHRRRIFKTFIDACRKRRK